jgi:hypothetical protein
MDQTSIAKPDAHDPSGIYHSVRSSHVIRETDADNPYGPNYMMLPYDTKLYYKWIRMNKFVHLQGEDQKLALNENYKFYGVLIGVGFCTFGLSSALKNIVAKRYTSKFYDFLCEVPALWHGFWIASGIASAFTPLQNSYLEHFIKPMMGKYRTEALDNGFQDYPISETNGQLSLLDRVKILS